MICSFKGEYGWLSNFAPVEIEFEDQLYSSLEHAYQAAKTFHGVERILIQRAETPGQAKRLGRKISIRCDWDQVKEDVMLSLLQKKFRTEPYRSRLVGTGSEVLVEGNLWHDLFWGKCFCGKHEGEGLNTLGRLLEQVREEIAQGMHG